MERIAQHGRPEVQTPYLRYVGQDEPAPRVRLHILSGRRNLEVAYVFRLVEHAMANRGAFCDIAAICLDGGQAAPLAAAFWAWGVPHSIDPALTKSARVSAAPVPWAEQVISALRLFVNPYDQAAFMDVVSMGLAPGRASLNKEEFAQVTQLSRERNLDLLSASRYIIQPIDSRSRLYRILTPLLDLHTELDRMAGQAVAPGTLRDFMEAATRIVAELRPDPPTLRDKAQVEGLLLLSERRRVPRGQTATQSLRTFLDRFSEGLHPGANRCRVAGSTKPMTGHHHHGRGFLRALVAARDRARGSESCGGGLRPGSSSAQRLRQAPGWTS